MKRIILGFLTFLLVVPTIAQKQVDSLIFSTPVALSLAVNSEYEESQPVFSKDSSKLYFVRTFHPDNVGGEYGDQDIWMSQKKNGLWSQAVNVKSLNNEMNNGAFGINHEGNTIYLLNAYLKKRNQFEKGVAIAYKKRRGWEHHPHTLPIPDLKIRGDYYGFHVTPDEKVLIISNKGAGTLGEEDLYVSIKGEGGKWSSPMHLGPVVNSAGYEISPFLSPAKDTLYFTSDGHEGYGQGDIFYCVRKDDSWTNWTKPKNLGPYINTEFFDAYFIRSGNDVYWSSNRAAGERSDIYYAKVIDNVWPPDEPKDTVPPIVADTTPPPPPPEPVIVQVPRDEIVYFDLDKAFLTFESKMTLDEVVEIMKEDSSLKARLEGHCDIRNTDTYNEILSKRRTASVMKYLKEHGVSPSRLSTGYYGEKELAVNTPSEDAPEDDHHRNRRVTISFGKEFDKEEMPVNPSDADIDHQLLARKMESGDKEEMDIRTEKREDYAEMSEGMGGAPMELDSGVIYKVQLVAAVEEVDLKDEFNYDGEYEIYEHRGMIKYTSTEQFATRQDANKHKVELRQKGFSEAFIVKFKDGERVK